MPSFHTPYDGSSRPFAIGLRPLDPRDWIEVDDLLARQLGEKERLISERRQEVFLAEPETAEAQAEVLALLVEHLVSAHASTHRLQDGAIHIVPARRDVDLADNAREPLLAAARLVQEDLVLMRRSADGWRLVAASLCFPSSWNLAEKFGRPLDLIHAPVPGFAGGTRPAALIARIFDSLRPDHPVERANWSLQGDDGLAKPLTMRGRVERADRDARRFADDAPLFMRVERQTLSRLPASGDILFTIRIHVDPLERLAQHPDRARIAASFASQLRGLDVAQLAYKGLAADREALAARIEALSRS